MNRLTQRCTIFMLFLSLFTVFYLFTQLSKYESNLSLLKTRQPCKEESQQTLNVVTVRSEHILCVVVPFRDRFAELLIFAPEISEYLNRKNVLHRILVMHQTDQYRFNRASLINVGYHESRRIGCDYLAMHDVDLLPLNLDLDYGYPSSGPYHVAAPEYHPKYHYNKFIGGILILTLFDYQLVNGMSNKYWGWGLEDDEFYLRIVQKNLKINRPQNLTTDTTNTFRHIHDKTVRKRDTVRIGDQKKESRKRDHVTGLNNLIYEIENRTPMTIANASLTIINVKLNCNTTFTPWCQIPR